MALEKTRLSYLLSLAALIPDLPLALLGITYLFW